jgi:hypothetical protein
MYVLRGERVGFVVWDDGIFFFCGVSDAVVWFGVAASGGHILGFRCFVSFGLHAWTNGGELVGWIGRQTWKSLAQLCWECTLYSS